MWNIKAIYPSGGHIVTVEGQTRFEDKQEALSIAETLNAHEKQVYHNNNGVSNYGLSNYQSTVYIVVEAR